MTPSRYVFRTKRLPIGAQLTILYQDMELPSFVFHLTAQALVVGSYDVSALNPPVHRNIRARVIRPSGRQGLR